MSHRRHASRFNLIIEDSPVERGFNLPSRQLEFFCSRHHNLSFEIYRVRNAATGLDLLRGDPTLPPPEVVVEAARLYDWGIHHASVFDGIPMSDEVGRD